MVVLEKCTVKDFRKLPEQELNGIHKTKSFYSEYSQGLAKKAGGCWLRMKNMMIKEI